MNSPCYNKITKTDCPKRCEGCAVNCPDWAKYVEERDKEYEIRALIGASHGLTKGHVARIRKIQQNHRRGFYKKIK